MINMGRHLTQIRSKWNLSIPGVVAAIGMAIGCSSVFAQQWIVGNSIDNMQDTSLVTSLFDQPTTLWHGPATLPSGWSVIPMEPFAAYGPCDKGTSCNSLTAKISTLDPSMTPYLMYDLESWPQTPCAERADPWDSIKEFVDLAHQYGFKTVIAPALDLFTGGQITSCTGAQISCTSGKPDWQCYLDHTGGAENLTLAREIGKYSDDYSIQSQANELDNTFYQFVSQAEGQAVGENPNIVIRDGTSTGKSSVGYPTASMLLQALDSTRGVSNLVGDWFNVADRPDTGLQVLEMFNHQPVYYAHSTTNMDQNSPTSNTLNSMFSLDTADSITWITSDDEAFPAGTVIPAGNYDWQYYTDGTSADSATVSLTVGYCTAGSCSSSEVPITSWNQTVTGGNNLGTTGVLGFVSQNTTSSATTLPSGGPYDIYITATVTQPSSDPNNSLDVLYGSGPIGTTSTGQADSSTTSYPTNLGIPAPVQQPHLVQVGPFTDGSSGTLAVSLPNPNQNGDRLIVTIAGGSGLTITAPNGWSRSVQNDNGTNDAEIWYYYNCPPNLPSSALTFTYTGANEARGVISEWAGLSTRDVTGSASTGSGRSLTVSTSGATSGTNDLAITAFTEHLNSSGTVTTTPGSGWTNLGNNDGSSVADHQTFDYKLGVSGTVSETESSSVSGASWVGVISTAKP